MDHFQEDQEKLKKLNNDPKRYQKQKRKSTYMSSDNTQKASSQLAIKDENLTEKDFI